MDSYEFNHKSCFGWVWFDLVGLTLIWFGFVEIGLVLAWIWFWFGLVFGWILIWFGFGWILIWFGLWLTFWFGLVFGWIFDLVWSLVEFWFGLVFWLNSARCTLLVAVLRVYLISPFAIGQMKNGSLGQFCQNG